MTTDLGELMALVAEKYPFTPETYSALWQLNEKCALVFAVTHVHLHMGKAMGVIAGVLEATDHNNDSFAMGIDPLRTAAAKLFANALQLATLTGLSAQELGELVLKVMK